MPPGFITAGEPLAPHTTIGLGGRARWFARCSSAEEIREAASFAREEGLPIQVFSGGSNILFDDAGYGGLVLQVALRGVNVEQTPAEVLLTAGAGEAWDEVVRRAAESGWSGIECLAGIPGSTGGTPVQNVGAYGQEVAETLVRVRAIDRGTLRECEFTRDECAFGYRTSRFKRSDAGRYIITEVAFRLSKRARPAIRYEELARALEGAKAPLTPAGVAAAVLALRRGKSMVIDPRDENTRSVGSFFTNPVVPRRVFDDRLKGSGVPCFDVTGGVKIPAAWLVEHAGFARGFQRGGAGISSRHALAIVNRGGTTADVLALAREIEAAVEAKFGIRLEREPVVVPYAP